MTRSLAIVPALVVIALAGGMGADSDAADRRLLGLLVLSQVILCFQLPFAIVPLVQCTSNPRKMGEFASRGWLKVLAWVCAVFVMSLDGVFIFMQIHEWAGEVSQPLWVYGTLLPLAGMLL